MNTIELLQLLASLSAVVNTAIGFSVSLLTGLVLVNTKHWHGMLSIDSTHGIQKFHKTSTPRIGGIPILIGMMAVWGNCSSEIKELLTTILIAGMPAFLFGTIEDLTKKVGTTARLLATIVSGILAWYISDYSLSRLDIWGLDNLLKFTLFSVLFTAFSISGIANAINIIDGFNGLAGLTCLFAFTGFALIAYWVQDFNLALLSLYISGCILGFYLINWPLGKLFLGDGGAYFSGFSLAWISILLIERNNTVSPFSALLICIIPITEVLFTIYRRKYKKQAITQPDRLHFHSLLKRRYFNRWFPHFSDLAKNSLVGLLIGLMNLIPIMFAVSYYDSTLLCIETSILIVLCYIIIYKRMLRHKWF